MGTMQGFKVDSTRRNPRALMPRRVKCGACAGDGRLWDGKRSARCAACEGSGVVYEFWDGTARQYLRDAFGERVRTATPDRFDGRREAVDAA